MIAGGYGHMMEDVLLRTIGTYVARQNNRQKAGKKRAKAEQDRSKHHHAGQELLTMDH